MAFLMFRSHRLQGWRAGMEDAHIALIKVPPGTPPSAAEIGAARIGSSPRASFHHPMSASQSSLENPGRSASLAATLLGVTTSESANPVNGGGSRGRAFTYPAEDAVEAPLSSLKASEGASYGDGAEGEKSGEGERSRGEGEKSAVAAEGGRGPRDDGRAPGDDSPATSSAASGENVTATAGAAAGWKAVDLLEDAALFGVFDGHGGKAVAEICRERLPGLLAASPEIRAGNWKTGFPQVFHAVDALIASGEAQEKGGVWGVSGKVDGVGVGCTIVTALLDKKRGECYVAHAGDSRGVLCRAGRAVQLTRDHKPRLPTEYARIVAAGGHVSRVGRVNDNLNLSRAIGDMAYKRNRLREPKDQIISAEPDVCRFSVTPGVDEFLLLGCDGVWEMMNSSEVVAFVRAGLRTGAAPLEVCENLLDASLSPDPRGTRYAGCDNMTVVLILFDGWETAVAKHTRARAMTYSGERRESAEEVVAGLPLIVTRPPRRDSEPHPPVSRPAVPGPKVGETGVRNAEASRPSGADVEASRAGGAGSAGPPAVTATASPPSASAMPIMTPEMPQHRISLQRRASVEILASSMPGGVGDVRRVNGIRLSRRRSEADSAALLARRLRAEAVPGWSSRRLSAGGMARPFNTTGIEFSLASFSAPLLPLGYGSNQAPPVLHRSSTSSSIIAAATAAGVRPRNNGSAWEGPHPTSRRRVGHLRSATAPMLPSPLIHHHRRSPSEDKPAITAALVAPNESRAFAGRKSLGLGEADPAILEYSKVGDGSALGEGGSPATGVVSTSPKCAAGGNDPASGRAEDAGVSLVFVPAPKGLSTVDLTVAASPRQPR